jgi:hypothetical protein
MALAPSPPALRPASSNVSQIRAQPSLVKRHPVVIYITLTFVCRGAQSCSSRADWVRLGKWRAIQRHQDARWPRVRGRRRHEHHRYWRTPEDLVGDAAIQPAAGR